MRLTLTGISIIAAIALFGLADKAEAAECQDRTTPLAGWASPVSQFSALQMMTADCIEGGVSITVGDGDRKTFAYGTAYYRRPGGNWTQFSLNGVGTPVNGYFREEATGFIPFEEDVDIAAYVCEYVGGAWKCGCVDAACAEPFWALQETTFPETPTPPPPGSGFVSQVAECTGPTIDVTPATLPTALANNDNATFRLAPGEYNYQIQVNGSCVKLTCSQPAIVNGQGNWSNGCVMNRLAGTATSQNYSAVWSWPSIGRLIVERLVIATNIDSLGSQDNARYGIRLFHADEVSIRDNWFEANTNHEIATKYDILYTEVYDNIFNNCQAICIENGQDPDITQQRSMSGEMIIHGNTFNGSVGHTIVNRNIDTTTIEQNTFINGNSTIYNWPLWQEYYGEKVMIPDPTIIGRALPLNTNVIDNSFTGANTLRFVSRGHLPANDLILLSGNTGSFSCGRYPMNYFNSNTANAHSNEVSTSPPNLAPGSDACPTF